MTTQDLQVFNQTVIFHENDFIFIQFICDFFEINRENQQRIIQNDVILCNESIKKSNYFLFKDHRQRLCLTKKGFIRWIQILNPSIVKESYRKQLINYQSLIFDYFYGEALVPNVKKQFEIDIRLKEINKDINRLMNEHKALSKQRKTLVQSNYQQLGLVFPDDNEEMEIPIKPIQSMLNSKEPTLEDY